MKVIFKTPTKGIKNLVIGKEYEVLEDLSDGYIISNELEIPVKYSKKFFEIPNPPKVLWAEEDLRVEIDGSRGGNYDTILISLDHLSYRIENYYSSITCGVMHVSNIQGILSFLEGSMNDSKYVRGNYVLPEEGREWLQVTMLIRILNKIRDRYRDNKAFLTFSPNDYYAGLINDLVRRAPEDWEILATPWKENPNSRNPIRWITISTYPGEELGYHEEEDEEIED